MKKPFDNATWANFIRHKKEKVQDKKVIICTKLEHTAGLESYAVLNLLAFATKISQNTTALVSIHIDSLLGFNISEVYDPVAFELWQNLSNTFYQYMR